MDDYYDCDDSFLITLPCKSGCCYVTTKSQCVSLFNLSSLAIFVGYQ